MARLQPVELVLVSEQPIGQCPVEQQAEVRDLEGELHLLVQQNRMRRLEKFDGSVVAGGAGVAVRAAVCCDFVVTSVVAAPAVVSVVVDVADSLVTTDSVAPF